MRVTTTIKEFIKDTVYKAIPIEAENICPEYIAAKEAAERAEKEIEKKVKAYCAELCKQKSEENNIPSDWDFNPSDFRIVNWDSYGTELYQKYHKALREAQNRRNEAIKEIILELELSNVDRAGLNSVIEKVIG